MGSRRDFCKRSVIVLGAATSYVLLGGEQSDAGEQANTSEQSNPPQKTGFRPYFKVHILGKEWAKEEAGGREFARTDFGSLSEREKELLAKGCKGFTTIDFEPKDLLRFDLYRGKSLIASNVNSGNYGDVLLSRETGKVSYNFVVTSPESEGVKVSGLTGFLSDEALFKLAVDSDGRAGQSVRLTPFYREEGTYPREFSLTFQNGSVEYVVRGLESLAGTDSQALVGFWKDKKRFGSDFKKFQKYYEDHRKKKLMVSQPLEVDR